MNKENASGGVLPKHVAIIPDGNRRWAKQQSVTPLDGHKEGVATLERISTHAADRGVEHLSAWGMSLDNLTRRPAKEIIGLFNIFRKEFARLETSDEIHSRQVRISVIGRWEEKFPLPVRKAIKRTLDATKNYTKHALNLFLAYNGTDDMLQAVKTIANSDSRPISRQVIKEHLLTKDLPPVDLLLRTGGEPHLSAGFMMWDIADAELFFTKKLWPEFTTSDFDNALEDYATRRRNRGK